MTITPGYDVGEEIERVGHRLAKATAAYMVRLKDIADITTLTTGSHGYDYAVTVSHADKPALLPLLSDLTFDIEAEYGVAITTLAVAGGLGKKKSTEEA